MAPVNDADKAKAEEAKAKAAEAAKDDTKWLTKAQGNAPTDQAAAPDAVARLRELAR